MNRIKELRKEKKLSREGLARLCGLSAGTIRNLEEGADARISTMQLVADALGVSVDNLLPKKVAS